MSYNSALDEARLTQAKTELTKTEQYDNRKWWYFASLVAICITVAICVFFMTTCEGFK